MYINEETAQLIFDAIAWCNRDWAEAIGWDENEFDVVTTSRSDFVRFCKERGIAGVERKIKVKELIDKALVQ